MWPVTQLRVSILIKNIITILHRNYRFKVINKHLDNNTDNQLDATITVY